MQLCPVSLIDRGNQRPRDYNTEHAVPKLGQILKVFAIFAVLVPAAAQATGFTCPASDASAERRKLDLGAADIAGTQPRISKSLRTTIEKMKTEGVKSGDIVDKLVVSYCARLDREPRLSSNDKADRVRRFASNLASVVYRGQTNDQEDIFIDVPVPASLYGQLQQAAETANVSQDTWIDQAIKKNLANP